MEIAMRESRRFDRRVGMALTHVLLTDYCSVGVLTISTDAIQVENVGSVSRVRGGKARL